MVGVCSWQHVYVHEWTEFIFYQRISGYVKQYLPVFFMAVHHWTLWLKWYVHATIQWNEYVVPLTKFATLTAPGAAIDENFIKKLHHPCFNAPQGMWCTHGLHFCCVCFGLRPFDFTPIFQDHFTGVGITTNCFGMSEETWDNFNIR